ncbi:MAG: cupin-like domain-containing protein [Pseudanabaenaceae cyanobacterium]
MAAKREIAMVEAHPYFRAGKNFTDALESHCKIRGQLTGKHYQQIERGDCIEQYYRTNTPLILTGMMGEWQALHKWRLDYFREHFGEVVVEVQFDRQGKSISDMVEWGGATNNSKFDLPEFRLPFAEVVFPADLFLPESPKGSVFFWLGPAGKITLLHHDPCNLMMAQIKIIPPGDDSYLYNYRGVFSQVDLTDPDYDPFPLFKYAHILAEGLHPSEIIFMPVGWWHFVESLDVSISVSMTHFSLTYRGNICNSEIRRWMTQSSS